MVWFTIRSFLNVYKRGEFLNIQTLYLPESVGLKRGRKGELKTRRKSLKRVLWSWVLAALRRVPLGSQAPAPSISCILFLQKQSYNLHNLIYSRLNAIVQMITLEHKSSTFQDEEFPSNINTSSLGKAPHLPLPRKKNPFEAF